MPRPPSADKQSRFESGPDTRNRVTSTEVEKHRRGASAEPAPRANRPRRRLRISLRSKRRPAVTRTQCRTAIGLVAECRRRRFRFLRAFRRSKLLSLHVCRRRRSLDGSAPAPRRRGTAPPRRRLLTRAAVTAAGRCLDKIRAGGPMASSTAVTQPAGGTGASPLSSGLPADRPWPRPPQLSFQVTWRRRPSLRPGPGGWVDGADTCRAGWWAGPGEAGVWWAWLGPVG